MVITKYRDLSMSPRSRYFPQPRPIIVKNWVFIELAIKINHINTADVVASAILSPGKTNLWNCSDGTTEPAEPKEITVFITTAFG